MQLTIRRITFVPSIDIIEKQNSIPTALPLRYFAGFHKVTSEPINCTILLRPKAAMTYFTNHTFYTSTVLLNNFYMAKVSCCIQPNIYQLLPNDQCGTCSTKPKKQQDGAISETNSSELYK